MMRARCMVQNRITTPSTASAGVAHSGSTTSSLSKYRLGAPNANIEATGAQMKTSDTVSSVTAIVK